MEIQVGVIITTATRGGSGIYIYMCITPGSGAYINRCFRTRCWSPRRPQTGTKRLLTTLRSHGHGFMHGHGTIFYSFSYIELSWPLYLAMRLRELANSQNLGAQVHMYMNRYKKLVLCMGHTGQPVCAEPAVWRDLHAHMYVVGGLIIIINASKNIFFRACMV